MRRARAARAARAALGVRALLAVLAGTVAAGGLWAAPAGAHPLGNFTVNLYSGLRVQPDRVLIDFVEDMAEIPAFQARREVDADGNGTISDREGAAWAKQACKAAAPKLTLTVAGRSVPVRSGAGWSVTFPPGAAGLSTLRLTCSLVAETGAAGGDRELVFRNANAEDRLGWREIVAVGDGTTLVSSSVPSQSRSNRLVDYPQDLLQSPLDQRSATIVADPGGPTIGGSAAGGTEPKVAEDGPERAAPRGVDRFSRSFTHLVARQHLTVAFGLLAVVLSVLLGAVHAFAPGHGKTVMAAYLVGRRGSYRHAAVIGLTMTATHTAGVLLLGVLLSTSTTLAPETLYPWLGLLSGLLLIAIGVALLARSVRLRRAREASAVLPELVGVAAGGGHSHADAHDHAHPHPHRHRELAGGVAPFGWRGLMAMGLVGGLVPSPSALVVLLGAIALGRAWFGVALVVAYGAGMAGTLLGLGIVLLRAQDRLDHRVARGRSRWFATLSKVLPAATAAVLIVVGLIFAVQGATRIGR